MGLLDSIAGRKADFPPEAFEALRQAKTLNDMFDVLDDYYDLDFELSALYKNIIISKLPHLVQVVGAKRKK